jgi:hypothetical protein
MNRFPSSLAAAALCAALIAPAGSAAAPTADLQPRDRLEAFSVVAWWVTHYGCFGFWGQWIYKVDASHEAISIECSTRGKKPFTLRFADTPEPVVKQSAGHDEIAVKEADGRTREIKVADAAVPAFLSAWRTLAAPVAPDERVPDAAHFTAVAQFMGGLGVYIACDEGKRLTAGYDPHLMMVDGAGLTLVCEPGQEAVRVEFADNRAPERSGGGLGVPSFRFRNAAGGTTLFNALGPYHADLAQGAWGDLIRFGEESLRTETAELDSVIAAYRAASPKPELPEDARRFKVQAEAAIREQRYADAAEAFRAALKLAPWWPQGRFNRALILAELGRHAEAIEEMKRYLALVPDAANARQAQDKVYEWEAAARR